jgi:hypothetical protein
MADYDETGQPAQFAPARSADFSTGINGDPSAAAGVNAPVYRADDFENNVPRQPFPSMTSEQAAGARFNAQVPRTWRPSSVLQPLMTNQLGLGYSAGDNARRMWNGKYLGSINGVAENSFEPAALLKMSGQDDGIS